MTIASRPAASAPTTGVVSRRVLAWVGVAAAVLDRRARDSGLETSDCQPEPCHLLGVCHRGHSVSARDGGTGGRAGRQRARVRRDCVHGHATVVAETIRRGRQPPRSPGPMAPPALSGRQTRAGSRLSLAASSGRSHRPAASRRSCAMRSPTARGTWNQRRHDPVQRLQPVNLPGLRERRDGEPGHGPRSVARRFRPLVSRVPARRTAVRVPRGQKGRRCLGAVSGLTRFDRDPAGGGFGSQRGGRGTVSDVAEQGRPGRAALRSESGRAQRLADRDRRSHCLGLPHSARGAPSRWEQAA